ncbi:hypothetical protein EY643_02355 [Halioglobus maricola]|uniref:Uncharacterized protein n=1 Tax=Halioglobus maricola TaxID=2601894 RepID=A0A5P9NGA1_9GAMM|nr:hypothetical protein [Halioglobus maricola]QFU74585.1 hypothetical protein EY643_02355 [Halioglobus maricola]
MYQGILLAVLIVLMGLLAVRIVTAWRDASASKPAPLSKRKTQQAASVQPWHSISCVGDCPALKTYKGKRFLVKNAPPLPVPGCTSGHCECRYVHYEDRRDELDDRRGLNGLRAELFSQSGKGDRREKHRGRRQDDELTLH